MSTEKTTANALAIGREKADEVLARRKLARMRSQDTLPDSNYRC
jgi:hypothetical protein